MQTITLRKATIQDKALAIDIDRQLDKVEDVELNRAAKITKAISDGHCFIISADDTDAGFTIFDYRFFEQGWIELIIIEEASRRKGIAVSALELICKQSKTDKVYTSTNQSNLPMQKALGKAGFTYAGKIEGLDKGDPELFYYKKCQ